MRSRCSERAHPRLIGAGNRHPADAGAARETKSAGYACRDSAEASVDAGSIPAASTTSFHQVREKRLGIASCTRVSTPWGVAGVPLRISSAANPERGHCARL